MTKNNKKIFNKVIYTIFIFLLGLMANWFTQKYLVPNSEIEAYYGFYESIPYTQPTVGNLKLDLSNDELNRFEININSIGDKKVEDIYIEITTDKKNLFLYRDVKYAPTLMAFLFVDTNSTFINTEIIHIEMSELPAAGKIKIIIESGMKFNMEDIKTEIIAGGKVVEVIRRKINLSEDSNKSFSCQLFNLSGQSINDAISDSVENKTALIDTTLNDFIKSNTIKNVQRGMYIGGYNPITLVNGIFTILQQYGFIKANEAQAIKEIVESQGSGLQFGGIDVLKFDETIINILIKKKLITYNEAINILERSKNSGGVLINGYNLIFLNYEILNILVKKGYISLFEAQKIIDNAKSK